MISVRSGRPMSRLSATRASKNARVCRGAANTRVRETSTWRMVSSHQNPAARSAAVSGSGRRAIHRAKNTSIVPGCSRSQMACSAVRVAGRGEPVGQLGEADPGLERLPLGPFVPVDPDLDRVGEVCADLDERRPEILIPQVEVVGRDPAVFLGEGELGRLARVGVPLPGGPHDLRLLGHPDRRDLGPAGSMAALSR